MQKVSDVIASQTPQSVKAAFFEIMSVSQVAITFYGRAVRCQENFSSLKRNSVIIELSFIEYLLSIYKNYPVGARDS